MTSGKKRPREDFDEAFKMRQAGALHREIGDHFGVGVETAREMVFRGARQAGHRAPQPWRRGWPERGKVLLAAITDIHRITYRENFMLAIKEMRRS